MEAEIIEPNPELRLILIRAPDDPPLSGPEYQKELEGFAQALRSQGIKVSSRWFTQDAVGGGGWSVGEFTLLATTLGPVVIVQLRKLIQAFLENRKDRKFKLQCGAFKIEGHAEDVQKVVTAEQIAKMLKSRKKPGKKTGHE